MKEREWLNSAEVRKLLKISTCELAHIRESGKISFTKKRNAYLYSAADCDALSNGAYQTDHDKNK